MSGGKRPREKGARLEREVVHLCQLAGFASEKVPLSGSARGKFSGDISVPVLGIDRVVECKSRKTGFKELYRWLDGRDFLVLKSDRHTPLIVVPIEFAITIAKLAEKSTT